MMNPLMNNKCDIVWNMHDLMNDLIYELKMTPGNFVTEIAKGLDNSEKCSDILNVLEYYNTLVLEEVQGYMKKYSRTLFDLIQKRRMAYVESVRRRRHRGNEISNDNMIDLTRDQDDTANLACGMGVIGRGIDKIEQIIQRKKYLVEQEKKNEYLRWMGMLTTLATVFVLAYIVIIIQTRHFYKI